MSTMYHLSDLRRFLRCRRAFALSRDAVYHESPKYIRMDEAMTELLVQRFGMTSYFEGMRSDPKERFLEAFSSYEWFIRPRLEYGSVRANIPLLHRTEEGNELYYIYMGLYPRAGDPIYYQGIRYLLEANGIPVHKIMIIHFNAEYVRGEELDIEQLFCISDCFYNDRCHPSITVQEYLDRDPVDLEAVTRKMDAYEAMEEPKRTPACTGRQKCMFYEECFPDEGSAPDDSILTLLSSARKYDMYEEGRVSLKDADPERIEGLQIQYAQIKAAENGGLFADTEALKAWLSHISYPIAFIDFEWERYAVPPYPGMRPFDVLLFEHSVHVLEEDGSVRHDVFLSFHDDRRELLEDLLEKIPETGSVVAYNASGAEIIRLRELAEQFSEYQQKLESIIDRMRDLQVPFENGLVYDTRLRGSISLKTITGMLDPHLYSDLEINKGMNAVFEWRRLDREEDSSDREKIIAELKDYCGMDTYAMLVVYRWLTNLCGQCTPGQ